MGRVFFIFLLVPFGGFFVSCEYALGLRLIPLSELTGEKDGNIGVSTIVSDDENIATLTFKYYEQSEDLKSVQRKFSTLYYDKKNYKFYTDKELTKRACNGNEFAVLTRPFFESNFQERL